MAIDTVSAIIFTTMLGQDDSFWEVISSDSEDEQQHEQTGRGEKRKSDDQDPQQDYYQIKSVREHQTGKKYGVHFNNVPHDVNLLETQNRTYGVSPGSGRRKRQTLNIRDHLKKKGSVITINTKDDICLARALVVSIARIEKDPRYNYIRKSSRPLQRERAFELHLAANIPLGPCGLNEVDLFQHYLVNYQIIVVSGDQNNAIIYPPQPPTNPNPEKSIYLYYQDNHFDVIRSLPGFLNRNYFCHRCHKCYDHTTDHLCKDQCQSCRGFGCTIKDNGMTCQECHRLFKNQACYDRHKQEPINGGGRTMCEAVKKCPTCKKSMNAGKLNNHPCVD